MLHLVSIQSFQIYDTVPPYFIKEHTASKRRFLRGVHDTEARSVISIIQIRIKIVCHGEMYLRFSHNFPIINGYFVSHASPIHFLSYYTSDINIYNEQALFSKSFP